MRNLSRHQAPRGGGQTSLLSPSGQPCAPARHLPPQCITQATTHVTTSLVYAGLAHLVTCHGTHDLTDQLNSARPRALCPWLCSTNTPESGVSRRTTLSPGPSVPLGQTPEAAR